MESCKAAAKSGMPSVLAASRWHRSFPPKGQAPGQAPTAAEESKAKKTRAMGVDYVGLWNIGSLFRVSVVNSFIFRQTLSQKKKLNILMSLPSKPSNLCMNRNA